MKTAKKTLLYGATGTLALFLILTGISLVRFLSGPVPVPEGQVPKTVAEFRSLSITELDMLYQAGNVSEVPAGDLRGFAIPGSSDDFHPFLTQFVNDWIWKGKSFSSDAESIHNLIGPFSNHLVHGAFSLGESSSDGAPTFIVDYSATSEAKNQIGDEIRWIGDGMFLGYGVRNGEKGIYFVLMKE